MYYMGPQNNLDFGTQIMLPVKQHYWGTWVAQSVKCLPSAQVMVPGSWDQAPHRAPCSAGDLLLSLVLSLCQVNKKYIYLK